MNANWKMKMRRMMPVLKEGPHEVKVKGGKKDAILKVKVKKKEAE